jgi:hypothetical protein
MSKLKCILFLLMMVYPAVAQKLSGRLGNPARPFAVTAEIKDEGSFELQRSVGSLTNWLGFTNFNSLPATNTYGDKRTNSLSVYRLVRLNAGPTITNQPVGGTNNIGQQIELLSGSVGSWPLRFQWMKDGQALAGATSNRLVLSNVTQSGTYRFTATNLWGTATSAPVVVKIVNPANTPLAGKKIRYVIKGGQGGVVTSGSVETTYFGLGNYSAVSANALLNDQGFWNYGFSSTEPLGRIVIGQSFIYPDGTFTDLTFTNETSGTFLLQVPNTSARQSGDFAFVP